MGSLASRRHDEGSSLVGALDLRVQDSLGCAGSGSATPGPPEDERRPNSEQRAEQWSCHIDPVIREVRPDEVRAEGSSGVHGGAGDRAPPQARESDVGADADGAPHPDVLRADAVPRITLTKPSVSTDSIRNASNEEKPAAG